MEIFHFPGQLLVIILTRSGDLVGTRFFQDNWVSWAIPGEKSMINAARMVNFLV